MRKIYPTKRMIKNYVKRYNLDESQMLDILCRFVDCARRECFPAEDLKQ